MFFEFFEFCGFLFGEFSVLFDFSDCCKEFVLGLFVRDGDGQAEEGFFGVGFCDSASGLGFHVADDCGLV